MEKRGILKRLSESLFGVTKPEAPKPSAKVVVHDIKQAWGLTPTKSFSTLLSYFMKDSLLYTAITHMAMETARPIKIIVNPEYTIRIEDKSAQEYLETWAQRVNLDGRISLIALELIATGNHFIRLMSDGSIQSVPLTGVERLTPVDKTTPLFEKYNVLMSGSYGSVSIPWYELTHFKVAYTSDGCFGIGVIEPMLFSTNTDAPSLMTMREKLRIAMTNLALKAGAPSEYIVGELDDADVEAISKELESMPYWGKRAVLNKKVDVITSMLPRSGLMDAWNDLVEMETFAALGDPILRLSTQPGFTEASSKTAEAMHQKRIEFYQRVIKRGLEQVLYKILEKSAYNPDQAQAKIEFINQVEVPEEVEPVAKEPEAVQPKEESEEESK